MYRVMSLDYSQNGVESLSWHSLSRLLSELHHFRALLTFIHFDFHLLPLTISCKNKKTSWSGFHTCFNSFDLNCSRKLINTCRKTFCWLLFTLTPCTNFEKGWVIMIYCVTSCCNCWQSVTSHILFTFHHTEMH